MQVLRPVFGRQLLVLMSPSTLPSQMPGVCDSLSFLLQHESCAILMAELENTGKRGNVETKR